MARIDVLKCVMRVLKLNRLLMSASLACFGLSVQAAPPVVDLYGQADTSLSQDVNINTEIVMQLEALQTTVRELRGELELQKHQLQQLHQSQVQLFQDVDKRLQELASKDSSTPVTAQSFTALHKSPATPLTTDVSQSDEIAYQKAYLQVEQQRYTSAATALQQFLKHYPKSRFVPNAHYWLGELYSLAGETDQAILEFNIVIQHFPQHAKSSDALLKVGYLYCDKALFLKAEKTLKQVVEAYPNSASAKLAAQRLQHLHREGRV